MKQPSLKLVTLFVLGLFVASGGCGKNTSGGGPGGDGGTNGNGNDNANSNGNVTPPACPDGTDLDEDGYGVGCPAGGDCDDQNPLVNPGMSETCNFIDDDCDNDVDENVLSACNNCSSRCTTEEIGSDPFPTPPDDPNAGTDGVGLDPNGDIVLDQTNVDFNFLWIANSEDLGDRGTVTKIDTTTREEVARYFSVTCYGNPSWQTGACEDINAQPVQLQYNRASRTAVDFNFDVWVANRANSLVVNFRQPSATKIVNNQTDCIDRNGDGVINTSQEQDGVPGITTDCDGNGQPDDLGPVCPWPSGIPEFLGLDDECVLFTVNYAADNEWGRSMCLDAGDPVYGGAGNAWVGTFNRAGNNQFYKLDGATGQILDTVNLPAGVSPYGCAVDSQGILWTLGGRHGTGGQVAYFDTANTANIGGPLSQPYTSAAGAGANHANNHMYGIGIDSDDNVWMGGWDTQNTFRYRPDRTSFATMGSGAWTRIQTGSGPGQNTRGIAADLRGWIWVAANNGYIYRVPQNISDGDHTWATAQAQGAIAVGGGVLGGNLIGVGIDFDGHLWGMSYNNSTATALELDQNGDLTGGQTTVPVGFHPYTYSDFTGYGLRNFTRPRGTYGYLMSGCADPANEQTRWHRVEFTATTPPGTEIRLQVRTGPDPQSLGDWAGFWDASPAELDLPPGPVVPNPANYLYVEFELTTDDQEITPILHDFNVIFDCEGLGPG